MACPSSIAHVPPGYVNVESSSLGCAEGFLHRLLALIHRMELVPEPHIVRRQHVQRRIERRVHQRPHLPVLLMLLRQAPAHRPHMYASVFIRVPIRSRAARHPLCMISVYNLLPLQRTPPFHTSSSASSAVGGARCFQYAPCKARSGCASHANLALVHHGMLSRTVMG